MKKSASVDNFNELLMEGSFLNKANKNEKSSFNTLQG